MSAEMTAAILVIGDEILSGRTKDKNIVYIAEFLGNLGVDLREARIVPDEEKEIIDAVNALRLRYTYVFTTGGIGPTHDDITVDSIAKAFGVKAYENQQAIEMLLTRIKLKDLNEARRRMARIPEGAELLANAASAAPGFIIENVIVMAGVPSIMQAMLGAAKRHLKEGPRMLSETIDADGLGEGNYAKDLAAIAAQFPQTSIGSYPSLVEGKFHNQIVVRSKDPDALQNASMATRMMLAQLSQ